jgi:Cu-Zn family superoxide dismutase
MRLIHTALFAAITTLGLSACNKPADTMPDATPAAEATAAQPTAEATPDAPPAMMSSDAHANHSAVADLAPTQGNAVKGNVTFSVIDGKVHVKGEVSGLKPNSEHGFHIHETGDCSAPDGASAGGHFNPGKEDHGSVAATPHHGGDMPNIKADAQGNAVVDADVSTNVNIGKGDGFDIIGRGLIVHADADDYKTQPTGNAGARLACAVIKAAP